MTQSRTMEFNSLRVHFLEGYIQNIILVEQEGRLLLFDSGCINDVKRIQRYCQENLHRSPTDIKLTAVTHIHPDHAGGAVCLRKRFGIPIAAHKDVDRWYRGMSGLLQHQLDCYLATVVAVRNRRRLEQIHYRRRINPDYRLEDGQKLPFFPEWKVIHVPGHIAHDLAFYHEKEQVLYTADLICDVKGQPQLPLPIVFPQKMAESYDRLGSLPVRAILRAHGKPIITENSAEIFAKMRQLLNQPPTPFVQRIWKLSNHSPEIKKLDYK
ncbi:MAG TPA: MBL fold metallo-hydrolase [Syntrophomonadaceae bacterium]|nr:MBL fold metallo-hydrolase [Syntrophomonadaceae bacterium]HQD90333.1 MBL fold metallo-hydrolase [Syntrophomonadaceae bacterium]